MEIIMESFFIKKKIITKSLSTPNKTLSVFLCLIFMSTFTDSCNAISHLLIVNK